MRYIVTLNGKDYAVEVSNGSAQIVDAKAAAPKAAPAAAPAPKAAPAAAPAPKAAPAPAPAAAAAGATKVLAPMPGNIFKVFVKVGDKVTSGQAVIVLEAMKMENEIFAPCDGVVASVNVSEGGSVNSNDLLISIN